MPTDAVYSPLMENDPAPDRGINPQNPPRKRNINVVELREGPSVTKDIEKSTLENVRVLDEDGHLVKQFWYRPRDAEGTIWYKQPKEDNDADILYARLIGVDTWSYDLCKVLLNVSLLVSKTMAQAQYASVLLTSDQYEETPPLLVHLFIGIFLGGSTLWVLVALYSTQVKMKALALASTDHIQQASLMTRATYFMSQLVFQMFNVPDSIARAPVNFHPRKAVQPFSVLKVNGARLWVLGYPTLAQYHSENESGALTQLPATVFLTIPLVVIQLLIGDFERSAFVSLALSILSVLLRVWEIWILRRYRREFYSNLKQSVACGLEGCNDDGEKRQLLIHHKLLLENFHVKVPPELQEEYRRQFRQGDVLGEPGRPPLA